MASRPFVVHLRVIILLDNVPPILHPAHFNAFVVVDVGMLQRDEIPFLECLSVENSFTVRHIDVDIVIAILVAK